MKKGISLVSSILVATIMTGCVSTTDTTDAVDSALNDSGISTGDTTSGTTPSTGDVTPTNGDDTNPTDGDDTNPTDGDDTNPTGGTVTPVTQTPIVPYTYNEIVEDCGLTFNYELGADGELDIDQSTGELVMIPGINSMEITQVIKEEAVNMTDGTNVISATVSTNFATGEQHIVGDSSTYGHIDCVYNYESPLPITIYSDESIDPSDIDIEDETFLNDTCPEWMDDETIQADTFESMSNISITNDDTGVESHVSEHLSLQGVYSCDDENNTVITDSTLVPLVPYTYTDTESYNGQTFTTAIGADGELEEVDGDIEMTVDEMYITQIIKEEAVNLIIDGDDVISAHIDSDFEAGTEHYVGTSSEHGDFDCTNEYLSPLPISVESTDDISVDDIYFYDDDLVSTDCPDWINDDEDDAQIEAMVYSTNVTLTNDDTGVNSNISEFYSLH